MSRTTAATLSTSPNGRPQMHWHRRCNSSSNRTPRLRQQLAREARKRLDAEVAAAVPDFRSVDADSRWHQWLLTIDPMLGRPRQAFLSEAIQAADAPRVISFFRQFQREVGHSQNVNDSTGRLPPGQRRASAPHGQIYTRAQVRDLYAAHFRGAYRAGRRNGPGPKPQ